MGQPRKVATAFDFVAAWNGSLASGASAQVAFTPIAYNAGGGVPPNAPNNAVPALIAHEILVSNPGTTELHIAVASAQDSATKQWRMMDGNQLSMMKPVFVDPTAFPAPTAGVNMIVVPPGAIAFPIRVKAFGLTVLASGGAATPSIQAYGPLSLES